MVTFTKTLTKKYETTSTTRRVVVKATDSSEALSLALKGHGHRVLQPKHDVEKLSCRRVPKTIDQKIRASISAAAAKRDGRR